MADYSDRDGEHSSDEETALDPRIKAELESLNSAAESINKLENELQHAKAKFRHVKTESSQKLSAVSKQIGKKWIIKARPYYDLLKQSQKAQIEAQRAASKFQRANGVYKAAKETVTLAEERLFAGDDKGKIDFDSTWQDVLNHATAKFMQAEHEKSVCELEHETKASEYAAIQQRLAFLTKDIPRTINKAKPFYELKDRLEGRLHAERQNAEDLQLALICSKQKYRMALMSLEAISTEVHTQRKMRRQQLNLELPLRTPGVGAELDSDIGSELSDMPSATLDFMSETASQVSWDDFSDSRCASPAFSVSFDDTPWDDDVTSPESRPSTSFASEPPPPPPIGPPTFTSSMWTRFGNGLSRLTQDIIKVPAVNAGEQQTTEQTNIKPALLFPRDDVVDGAESDSKKEQSELSHSASWNLPESLRTSLTHQSSSSSSFVGIGNWSNVPTKHNPARDQKTTQMKSPGDDVVIANVTSDVGSLCLNSSSGDGSLTKYESSETVVETACQSPSRSPFRRSVSEISLSDKSPVLGVEMVHSQTFGSPGSELKVTSKPPLPRHRRSPSATVVMEGNGRQSDQHMHQLTSSPARKEVGELGRVEHAEIPDKSNSETGRQAINSTPRKALKLASGSPEIFV